MGCVSSLSQRVNTSEICPIDDQQQEQSKNSRCLADPFATELNFAILLKVFESEEDYEIDENYVYSALFKLSFLFEIDAMAPMKMTKSICENKFRFNFDDQCKLLKAWTNHHFDVKLNADEARNLLKYVKLYTPPVSPPKGGDVGSTGGSYDDFDYSHLVCPFRCNFAAWSAEINRQVLSTSVPLYADTSAGGMFTMRRLSAWNATTSLRFRAHPFNDHQ